MRNSIYGLGLLLALLAGCGGSDDDTTERHTPAGGIWYEADFLHDPNAAAQYHHTVVLDLEPADYVGEALENRVRYELDAGSYRFCIDPEDDFITGFTLENEAGETVLTLDRFSECHELDLPAGIYTKRIQHDGDEIVTRAVQAGEEPASRVAFVQAPNTLRLSDKTGQPLGGWWVMHVVAPSDGNLHHNTRCTSCTDHLDFDSGWTPVTNQMLFKFTHQQRLGGQVSVPLMVVRTPLGGSNGNPTPIVISSNSSGQPVTDPILDNKEYGWYWLQSLNVKANLLECRTTGLQTGIAFLLTGKTPVTQSQCAANPLIDENILQVGINDLGNYSGQLYVVDQKGRKRLIETFNFRPRDLIADFDDAFQQDARQKLVFFVAARLFAADDPDYDPELPLQEGEVALFDECHFQGNMWVFGGNNARNVLQRTFHTNLPDLKLDDNIASIRLGPLTTATLYSENFFQGVSQRVIGDQACLDGSIIGSNTASSLKIGGSAIDVLISSNSCVGCKLPGVNLSSKDLRNVDLRQADLRNATLSGAKLRKAKFNEALLSGSETNLNYAELRQADFTGAKLNHASLEGADLRQAVLADADLSHAKLSKAHIYQKIDLTRTTLDEADFSEALMAEVKFSGSIKDAIFNRAVLVNAEFDNSDLDQTSFHGAWLIGVNFSGATSVNSVHLTNACVSTQSGVWSISELRRSFRYNKTVLGPLASDTSVFCPNGQNKIQCCPGNDTAQCAAAALTPTDAGADLHNPKPPPCLPDQAVLDDPEADDALLCPPPQLGDKSLQNCSILQ